MTEILRMPVAEALEAGDELLLLRNQQGRRMPASALAGTSNDEAIAFSETPPTDKALWWQMADGMPVAFWMLRPSGVWVSEQVSYQSTTLDTLTGNKLYKASNPMNGRIWLDYFSVSGRSDSNFSSGRKWRFELSLINSQAQEVPYHFLELQSLTKGEYFSVSEFVGEAVAAQDALAVWRRVRRIANAPKLKYVSLTLSFRRIYGA